MSWDGGVGFERRRGVEDTKGWNHIQLGDRWTGRCSCPATPSELVSFALNVRVFSHVGLGDAQVPGNVVGTNLVVARLASQFADAVCIQ